MTATFTIVCVPPPVWTRPPSIRLPNLGPLEYAWDAVSSIPDPTEILTKFMNSINVALASLKKYLRVVEAIMAIKECLLVIPKCITSLSPRPLFDCAKKLIQILVYIIQDIPPIPYIITAIDVIGICIDVVDALINLMTLLDNKITALLNIYNYAANLGDIELLNFVNCGLSGVKLTMQQLLDVLKLIKPINDMLIPLILMMVSAPDPIQKAALAYAAASAVFDTVQNDITNGTGTVDPRIGLPSLTPMAQSMAVTRNALSLIYDFLAPYTGVSDSKGTISPPTFQSI